jgi:hypothetical protein
VEVDQPVVAPVVGDVGIGRGALLALDDGIRVGELDQPVQQLLEPGRRSQDPGTGVQLQLREQGVPDLHPHRDLHAGQDLRPGAGLLDRQRPSVQSVEAAGQGGVELRMGQQLSRPVLRAAQQHRQLRRRGQLQTLRTAQPQQLKSVLQLHAVLRRPHPLRGLQPSRDRSPRRQPHRGAEHRLTDCHEGP